MAPPVRVRQKIIGEFEVLAAREGNEYIGRITGPDGTPTEQRGPNLEILWNRLLEEVGKAGPDYFGYEAAMERFLHFFGKGFESPNYNRADGECGYKREAKRKLDQTVPLKEAVDGKGFGTALLDVYRATDLVEPRFEMRKVDRVLRSADADAFVQGVASFALNPDKVALRRLEALLRPHGAAAWTIVTYLPFLWLPERHMFLKPTVTKDYASRVGHRFVHEYESGLEIGVYESLLDLATETERQIDRLRPRNRIDIQSFIWVVGSYEKGKHLPQE